ncbi:MAG: RNA polymerase sigma factor [Bacteroidales bacterium]|nr:RNA polymerase sigma factor [Bacteroidales bacterium]
MTDNEIIKDILEGNKDAFRLLVERYQQSVFRTVMGFLHDKDEADDLSQDIFIQAYLSLARFKGESAFSTWLYRITLNACLNKTRKSPLQKIFRLFENTPEADREIFLSVIDSTDPENIMIQNENAELVRKALDSLPENQRIAIVLSKYDDLPQREIAEIMKTSEGAVESLLQRAKKNLREILSGRIKKNH